MNIYWFPYVIDEYFWSFSCLIKANSVQEAKDKLLAKLQEEDEYMVGRIPGITENLDRDIAQKNYYSYQCDDEICVFETASR